MAVIAFGAWLNSKHSDLNSSGKTAPRRTAPAPSVVLTSSRTPLLTPLWRGLVAGTAPISGMKVVGQSGDMPVYARASDVPEVLGVPVTAVKYQYPGNRLFAVFTTADPAHELALRDAVLKLLGNPDGIDEGNGEHTLDAGQLRALLPSGDTAPLHGKALVWHDPPGDMKGSRTNVLFAVEADGTGGLAIMDVRSADQIAKETLVARSDATPVSTRTGSAQPASPRVQALLPLWRGMEPGSKPLAGMERGILERNGGWRYSRQESGPVTVLGVPAGGVDYVYSYDRLWAVVYGVEPEHAEQVRHTLETTLGAPDATSPDGVLIWYDEPGTKKWRLRAEYYVTDGVGTVRVEDGKTGGEINALVEQEEREKKTKFPYVLHASCEGPGGLTLPVGGCFPNSTVKVRTESATKVYGTVEMLGMLTNNEEFTLGLPPHFEIAASNSGQRGMRLHVWITDRADKKHFEDYAERFGWVKVAN